MWMRGVLARAALAAAIAAAGCGSKAAGGGGSGGSGGATGGGGRLGSTGGAGVGGAIGTGGAGGADIKITSIQNPVAITASTTSSSLLVTDNGVSQNVKQCLNLTTAAPNCGRIYGQEGGVFGTSGPGSIADPKSATQARFYSPVGAGFGPSGSVYVAWGAPEVGVSKITGSGPGLVAWSTFGVGGAAPGGFDPGTNGSYYTPIRRMSFDLSQPPGNEWKLAAITWNPFSDAIAEVNLNGAPQLLASGRKADVRVRQNNIALHAPMMRRLNQSVPKGAPRLFMYLPYNMSNGLNRLAIFRFNGELTVPCGAVDLQVSTSGVLSLELWVDTNANGLRDTGEVTSTATFPPSPPTGYSIDVDDTGNIWIAFSAVGSNGFWMIKNQGVQPNGVPNYGLSYNSARLPFSLPADFDGDVDPSVGLLTRFDAATHTMYIAGWSAAGKTNDGCNTTPFFAQGGPIVAAYPSFDSGNLTASFKVSLTHPLPDAPDDFPRHIRDVDCGCVDDSEWGYNSISIAGSYVFIGERPGPIHVHRKSDLGEVTHLFPGAELSGAYAFLGAQNMQAVARPNNEYVVSLTDFASRPVGKIMRWTPMPGSQ